MRRRQPEHDDEPGPSVLWVHIDRAASQCCVSDISATQAKPQFDAPPPSREQLGEHLRQDVRLCKRLRRHDDRCIRDRAIGNGSGCPAMHPQPHPARVPPTTAVAISQRGERRRHRSRDQWLDPWARSAATYGVVGCAWSSAAGPTCSSVPVATPPSGRRAPTPRAHHA